MLIQPFYINPNQGQLPLSKGKWYRYNDDYLEYLRDLIAEIPTEYHPEYDFSTEIHNRYIKSRMEEARRNPEFAGKDDGFVRNELKKKFYAERVFNELMARDHGFENHDRNTQNIDGHDVEVMDLSLLSQIINQKQS